MNSMVYCALMALPNDYAQQSCSVASSLEVIGERWTLLIVRDAFFGVQRFSDFAIRLGIPRAVLTDRLNSLVESGVLVRTPPDGRRGRYELTPKGIALWPVVHALYSWGDEFYAPNGVRREFWHDVDGGRIDSYRMCAACGAQVEPGAIVVTPGPGYATGASKFDPVSLALAEPRHLLEPVLL